MVSNENYVDISPYVLAPIARAYKSDYKITLIYGWRDSGKSTSVFTTAIWDCLLLPHFRCAHCRAKYNEIAGSTFQTLLDRIAEMGLTDYFEITKDRFKITNKLNPNNFFFGASGDQPDKIRSTANLSHIIWDEMHSGTFKDFESLVGTLRERKGIKTKFVGIFNNDKVPSKGWIDETFFNPESAIYNDIERVLTKFTDNQFIDQDETRKKLLIIAMGDTARFNSLVNGEFVQEDNTNPYFFAFDPKKHLGYVEHMTNYETIVSFDFNIDPATCSVWQYSIGSFVHCLKSYRLENTTLEDLCKRLIVDYPTALFRVTGDPSGNARHASNKSVNDNLYTIIKRVLNLSELQVDQPVMKLQGDDKWREARILCNLILQNHPNLIFNEATTKDLIHEIQIARPEEGRDKLYKTAGPTEYGMNLVDGWMYFALTYLVDYLKY